MKRLLNTLYVTREDAWLAKDGANIVVKADGVELGRSPIHMLGAVVCFSRIGMSPALMGYCAQEGVAVTFLTEHGRFLARVEGPQSGNVLLRRAQHRATGDAAISLYCAAAIVAVKAANQRAVLRRYLRDYPNDEAEGLKQTDDAARRLADVVRRAPGAADEDILRGLEGEGARAYFSAFNVLIRCRESAMAFHGRSRQPPRDPPNAVISFLYAVLAGDCRAALERVGLDPQMGFLHKDRPGRPSLALDLLEEFRAPMADRILLSLFNRRQLHERDFTYDDGGGVRMGDDARKTVLVALQERKRVEITHPFLKEKMPLGLVPFVQAQLMARWLRGDLDGYPPYIWS